MKLSKADFFFAWTKIYSVLCGFLWWCWLAYSIVHNIVPMLANRLIFCHRHTVMWPTLPLTTINTIFVYSLVQRSDEDINTLIDVKETTELGFVQQKVLVICWWLTIPPPRDVSFGSKVGQIWDFGRLNVSTFWPVKPKCTDILSGIVPDL